MLLPFPRFIATLWMALALLLGALAPGAQAASGTYEAELPAGLATATDMCALLPCKDVFPGATEFSDRMGQPPYVEAYDKAGEGRQLLGYVMLSTDITDTPAYSGKPVVTLIGMDKTGHFVGVKVLKHSEPILLLGIPESALLNFNNQYLGKSVADKIEIGQSRPDEDIVGLDAISGATVTVIAQNQVMMASGSAVARQVGILAPVVREAARYKVRGEALTWDELVGRRAVEHLRVMPEQLGQDRSADPFIELWFGDLSHPDIGKSVLGEADWENLHRQLKEGEHAIFVIRTAGRESFKGSGFVRGGLSLQQVNEFVAQHANHADVLLFSPQPDMGAFFLNVFEQGEAFDAGLIDCFSGFLQHIGRPAPLRSLVMDSRQVVFSNYFIARPAFWREWLQVNEAMFAICEGLDTSAPAALRAELTKPTTYATGGKPAERKVFLQERVASLLLATQPQWRSVAHDPFGMGWSMSRFRQHPTEAFISDALKLAWRVQPYPEYLQAFATLRDRFSKGQLPVAGA